MTGRTLKSKMDGKRAATKKNLHHVSARAMKSARAFSDAPNSSFNKMKNVVVVQDDTNDEKSKNKSSTSRTARVENPLICGICFENKPCSDLLFIKGCFHSFCSRCVAGYVSSKVEENVANIVCPDPDCKSGAFEPEFCKTILARKVFDRWCDVLCESIIKRKFYCPFKDCSALLVDERDEELIREAECPHCHRLFCAECRTSWHPELACEDYQKLEKNEREREDFLLMNLAKEKDWKRCPVCRFYVEKVSGCLFLHCRCGHTFCYGCGRTMTQDHYCPVCKR